MTTIPGGEADAHSASVSFTVLWHMFAQHIVRSVQVLSTANASPLVHHITKMAKHADIKAATEGKGCSIVFQ